ncbi:MAG: imelysin family protein [Bacteroidota bacterium]
MKNWYLVCLSFLAITTIFTACGDEEKPEVENPDPTETDFTDHLTNQVNNVVIPTMETYQTKMADFTAAVGGVESSFDETSLDALRAAYQEAYLAYQAVVIHNYFATPNLNLVNTTNLYPIDTELLANFIESRSYNFSTVAQERANGFPAIDFMLYGSDDVLSYFKDDNKRLAFLKALVNDMKLKADALVDRWTGNLKTNFIENGGTQLGSSISVQLNESLVYYEDHVRENKVGIPIGRLGPNDSPITPDATKIEAYYQSLAEGNEQFTFALLKAAIEEMEDMYLGETAEGTNGKGYDDLLLAREQAGVDEDIKAQFQNIYDLIEKRTSVAGNEELYSAVQEIVTLYKSDLFPVLNVQDADGSNDGD